MASKLVTRCESEFLSLGKKDWFNGLKLAIMGAVAATLYSWISQKHFPTGAELVTALQDAGYVGGLYLTKKFFTIPTNEAAPPVSTPTPSVDQSATATPAANP